MAFYRATIAFDVRAETDSEAVDEAQSVVWYLGDRLINSHPDKIMKSSGFQLVGVEDEDWNDL